MAAVEIPGHLFALLRSRDSKGLLAAVAEIRLKVGFGVFLVSRRYGDAKVKAVGV